LGLKQPDFASAASLTEIICFPLSPPKAPSMAGTRFGRFLRLARRAVLVTSPYAYQKASWLVPAKKELVGDFKNGGRELRPKGKPELVRTHDFAIPELGKVAPYGVYDIAANDGWVNLGISHDTAAFAVASIRRWWLVLGAARYPTAKRLLINADCGGSNGNRVRLWKRQLQALADELGIAITVNHLPPGTSKWNRIEHKLFAFITMNWRGKPLVSYLAIIQLIGSTTTDTGLTVTCQLDANAYEKGIKVSDDEMASLNVTPASFHGEWNYTIAPRRPDG
jgi:hypothetical protein